MIFPFVTLTTVWPPPGSRSRTRRRAAGEARRSRRGRCPGTPYGSPSSRLPRRPMWPLESANTDSVWASASRSSRSRARPRLDRERRVLDHDSRAARPRSRDDDVGAVLLQRRAPGRPDRRRRRSRSPRLARPRRRRAHPRTPPRLRRRPRARARRRGRCPAPACRRAARASATWPSMTASKRSVDPARREHVAAVRARRHDGPSQPRRRAPP